jgi:very-short-patch-repair endonuclease
MMKKCKQCESLFLETRQRRYFCSAECYQEWNKVNLNGLGDKHRGWKGGAEVSYKNRLKKQREETKLQQDKIGYWSTGENKTLLVLEKEREFNISMEDFLLDEYFNKLKSTRDIAKLLNLSNKCIVRWITLKMKKGLREQSCPSIVTRMKQSENLKKRKLSQYKKPTEQEQYVVDEISKFNYELSTNHPVEYDAKIFYLDIAIPSKKICIEVDGIEHYGNKKIEDEKRTIILRSLGWRVFRVKSKTIDRRKGVGEKTILLYSPKTGSMVVKRNEIHTYCK